MERDARAVARGEFTQRDELSDGAPVFSRKGGEDRKLPTEGRQYNSQSRASRMERWRRCCSYSRFARPTGTSHVLLRKTVGQSLPFAAIPDKRGSRMAWSSIGRERVTIPRFVPL